jgi:hypothetical protein
MKIKQRFNSMIVIGLLFLSTQHVIASSSSEDMTATNKISQEKEKSVKAENTKNAHLDWTNLPQDVRLVLAQVESKWMELTNEKKQIFIAGAKRWLSLNPEQKQEFSQRYNRWYQLPEGKRKYFADLWFQFKQLSPYKQNRIRIAFKRFNRMSEENREQLWAQWRQLPVEQRALYRQQTFGVVSSTSSKTTATSRATTSKKAVFPIVKSTSAKKKDK